MEKPDTVAVSGLTKYFGSEPVLRLEGITEEDLEKNPFWTALNQKYKPEVLRGCTCGNTRKNATTICTQNYNTIRIFYNSLAAIPNSNPWVSTVGYWVSFVRENGAWDYKVHWTEPTYCFRVNGIDGNHKTSEWFGNYNYGFTGKFLFSLDILHAGSYAVSGFDPNDVTTDWPAIDLGYSHAP